MVECPFEKEQDQFYAEAREGVLQDIADLQKAKSVNMANVATLIGYLLQVADTVKSIDPETTIKEHSSKINVLKEMLMEEFPRKAKIVIFSRFSNKVIPYLIKELESLPKEIVGGGILSIVGGVSNEAQDKIILKMRTKKYHRILVCSDAMAYGGNLQFANYIVNFDLPWNPAVLDQRIRRVYRRGQKKSVTVFNMIVPGTVEEHLYQVLAHKRKLFTTFLKESLVQDRPEKKHILRQLISKI